MPTVAVIIANRNNARFLPQCLESVFRQTLRPAEVIVVDDASTDDSRKILQVHAAEGRISLILNDAVLGVSESRHRAIISSGSDLLTTLDADDFYYGADKLEREVAALNSSGPGRIAFSDVMRVSESGEIRGLVSKSRCIRQGDLSFHIPNLRGFIPRDYLVSRQDYFRAGGFNPVLRLYEDWDLKIRLSHRCSWHYSGVVGTAYRDNPVGLSKAPRREHIAAMRGIFVSNCTATSPAGRMASRARFFFYHSLYLRRPAI